MKSVLLTVTLVALLGAIHAAPTDVAEETFSKPSMDTIQLIPDHRRKDSLDFLHALGVERKSDLQRQVFTYNADLYSNWTEWSTCSRHSCKQHRFRQCVDDSYTKRISNPRRRNFCPFKFLMEERRCPNASECLENAGPSETLRRLSVTCGIRPTTRTAEPNNPTAPRDKWLWHVGLYRAKEMKEAGVQAKNRGDTGNSGQDEDESPTRHVKSDQQLVCGGSLLTPSWIVTSAHCLKPILLSKAVPLGQPFNLSGMVARVGGQHRAQKGSSGREYSIESAVIHPDWYPRLSGPSGFDVALLKLAVPVSPDEEGVDTICLADANATLSKNDKCYVVGWGNAGENVPCPVKGSLSRIRRGSSRGLFGRHTGSFGCRYSRARRHREAVGMPLRLREAKVTPVSLKKCSRWPLNSNKDHLICAGGVGKNVCTGDNGSGLYCHNRETDRWFLTGVIGRHWGHRCSESHSLFTSIPSVATWIHQQIQ